MAKTLSQQLAIEQVSPGEFTSKALPGRMGNSMPIAYGGCTLGVATAAACATVPDSHRMYSLLGHFLGPASTEVVLTCKVHTVRDTKTFATRRVQVKQKQRDGTMRTCLELLVDFHVLEPALLSYSAPPTRPYLDKEGKNGPDDSSTITELRDHFVSSGLADPKTADALHANFSFDNAFFDMRQCRDGVAAQTMYGGLKHLPTSQDALPITAKSSADWMKARTSLSSSSHQDKMAAVSFLMDRGLAFVPLSHNHMWFDDAGACSTLDFALRVFVPDLDLSTWHLREMTTSAAGAGRTYSEGRLWDQKGNLVVSMTQQCILRPRPAPRKVKAEL